MQLTKHCFFRGLDLAASDTHSICTSPCNTGAGSVDSCIPPTLVASFPPMSCCSLLVLSLTLTALPAELPPALLALRPRRPGCDDLMSLSPLAGHVVLLVLRMGWFDVVAAGSTSLLLGFADTLPSWALLTGSRQPAASLPEAATPLESSSTTCCTTAAQ